MRIFGLGVATCTSLDEASVRVTLIELQVLRDAAGAAVRDGHASEWALGVIHAGERGWFAIHSCAPAAVVASLATIVRAAWSLDIEEKTETRPNGQGSRSNGAQLRFVDLDARVLATRNGDGRFREEELPPRHRMGADAETSY